MIGSYLTDALFVLRRGTPDAFQTATETREPSLGYIEWGSRLVRSISGDEVVASAKVLMEYDATLSHEDRLEIAGVAYQIIKIEPVKDIVEVGMYVYLGARSAAARM